MITSMELLALLLTGLVFSPGSAPEDLFHLTLPEAIQLSRQTGAPILVYVSAPWCLPCRQLEKQTFSDPQVRERLAAFVRTRLIFDDEDTIHRVGPYRLSEAAWAGRFGAQSPPTLVILSPDGSSIGRLAGYYSPENIIPMLDAALAAAIAE